jgi:Fur family ferric uptake transcriptional regulator
MAGAAETRAWAEHALARLREEGLRRGGARRAVVETLARHGCAVTALEIEDELRERGSRVGRASIYRALDQLEDLGLVQRIADMSRGVAGYERLDPAGHHHHHAICDVCGRLEAFEDTDLESAIGRLEGRLAFEVAEHDVVLRGRCQRYAAH